MPDAYDDLAIAAGALRRARLRLHCLQCLQTDGRCEKYTSLHEAAEAAERAEHHYVTLRRQVIGC
jgi:hypothetical protein